MPGARPVMPLSETRGTNVGWHLFEKALPISRFLRIYTLQLLCFVNLFVNDRVAYKYRKTGQSAIA